MISSSLSVGRDSVISQGLFLHWGGRDPVISQVTSYTEEEETLWYHKPLHWGGRDLVISQGLFLHWGGRDHVISQAFTWGGRDPVISQAFTLRRKRPCDITSLYTEEEETLWYHKPLHWGGRDPVISQVSSYLRRKRPCDITGSLPPQACDITGSLPPHNGL